MISFNDKPINISPIFKSCSTASNNFRVHFTFITHGWGGNEIMATQLILLFLDMGCYVSISVKDAEQISKIQSLIGSAGCNEDLSSIPSGLSVKSIVVSPSYLHCLLRQPSRAIFNREWIYTPFWGFEWNKGLVRFLKLNLSVSLSRLSLILAVHHDFFSSIGLSEGNDFQVFPNVSRSAFSGNGAVVSERVVLICPGRVDFFHKQQDRILSLVKYAVSVKSSTNISLVFFGDGADRQTLIDLAEPYGWASVMPWSEPSEVFRDASVLVLGSRFEGLPLVALEAIEAGVPVIATRHCGLNRIIPEQSLFDESIPDDFVRSLEWTISHRIFANEFSRSFCSKYHSNRILKEKLRSWLEA